MEKIKTNILQNIIVCCIIGGIVYFIKLTNVLKFLFLRVYCGLKRSFEPEEEAMGGLIFLLNNAGSKRATLTFTCNIAARIINCSITIEYRRLRTTLGNSRNS